MLENDFSPLLTRFRLDALGLDLPEDHVPHIRFWLVQGDEFLGRVSLRSPLTPPQYLRGGNIGFEVAPKHRRMGFGHLLLSEGLQESLCRQIISPLVTCDELNTASRRIIEKAGGQFDASLANTQYPTERHFWFNLLAKLRTIIHD
jgi:predicted acetyltransferase